MKAVLLPAVLAALCTLSAVCESAEDLLGRARAMLSLDPAVAIQDAGAEAAVRGLVADMEAFLANDPDHPVAVRTGLEVSLFLLRDRLSPAEGTGQETGGLPLSVAELPRWSVPRAFGVTAELGAGLVCLFPVLWYVSDLETSLREDPGDGTYRDAARALKYAGYASLGLGGALLAVSMPLLASSLKREGQAVDPREAGERERVLLERKLSYARAAGAGYRAGIIGSLVTGVASFAAFGTCLWFGEAADERYRGALFSSDAAAYRTELERWRLGAYVSCAAGTAGIGTAVILALLKPDTAGLERRLAALEAVDTDGNDGPMEAVQ